MLVLILSSTLEAAPPVVMFRRVGVSAADYFVVINDEAFPT